MSYIDRGRINVTETLPELNMLYTHKSLEFKLEKVEQPPYKYVEDGSIHRDATGVIRYAQGVKIDGHTGALLLITKENRKTVVSKFFKEAVESIKNDKDLLEAFKEAWTVPVKLGIRL